MTSNRIRGIEIIYEACDLTLDLVYRTVPDGEMEVLKSFLKSLNSHFRDILDKAEAGCPIIGHHFGFPSEILHCFENVATVSFEAMPYLYSAILPQGSEYFYDVMNIYGHPYHTCSAIKGLLGMFKSGLLQFDLICTISGPCDNGISSYPYYAEVGKIPLFISDMPYPHDDRGIEYYTEELRRGINYISKVIGQEPDYSLMKKAIEYSNKTHEYLDEINVMRRLKPNPLESMTNPIITAAHAFMSGKPQYTQFFEDVYHIAKKRVKNHMGRRGFEKFRSIWPYMSLFFDFGFYEWMDREIGLSQILDIFNNFYFKPISVKSIDDMLEGLARKWLEYPMIRGTQTFIDTMIDDYVWAIKEYNIDLAVLTEHIGCKQLAATTQILKEALRDEGVPMCNIELDVGDKRLTSIETIKHEISEFIKTML
ncbi:MAG: 2-hydroxyacyl-CoA dehydratase [Candidatus Helarchaeota archaeon]